MNVIEKDSHQLLILTHDVSGISAAISGLNEVTLRKVDTIIFLAVKNIFLRAQCSESFINYYLENNRRITFSTSRSPKFLSVNSVATKHVKRNEAKINPDNLLQIKLTEKLNAMPRKSLDYKSPNEFIKEISLQEKD